MKKLVWISGIFLVLSFVFPNGIPRPVAPQPVPAPAPVVPPAEVDSTIVTVLADASPEDRRRITSVYNGLKFVILRDWSDKGNKRISTTAKLEELQGETLVLAIDTPGKYKDLDKAIESVFLAKIGTQDEIPVTQDVVQKIVKACEVVAASAETYHTPAEKK